MIDWNYLNHKEVNWISLNSNMPFGMCLDSENTCILSLKKGNNIPEL